MLMLSTLPPHSSHRDWPDPTGLHIGKCWAPQEQQQMLRCLMSAIKPGSDYLDLFCSKNLRQFIYVLLRIKWSCLSLILLEVFTWINSRSLINNLDKPLPGLSPAHHLLLFNICLTFWLFIHLLMHTRFPPLCVYCKQCYYEHGCLNISSRLCF